MALEWEHSISRVAHVPGGRYVIQADHIIRFGTVVEQRFKAIFVAAGQPAVSLGYHRTAQAAKDACLEHYNRRSRWDEDIEAGAIG